MSYKQIDEQFSDEYDKGMFRNDTATGDRRLRMWLIDFLHQIYDQAKAEQREIDAGIVENEKYKSIKHTHDIQTEDGKHYKCLACGIKASEIVSYKTQTETPHICPHYRSFNSACDSIATAIRQEGK
jgi:hypothetical protein